MGINVHLYGSSGDAPHCYAVLDSQSEAETPSASDAASIPRVHVALLFMDEQKDEPTSFLSQSISLPTLQLFDQSRTR
jgi:hypothetical protein